MLNLAMAEKQVTLCSVLLVSFSILLLSVSAKPPKRTGLLNIIKELNSKGPYIGLITVYPPEEKAFFSTGALVPDAEHPFVDLSGRRFRVGTIYGKKVIYVRCGVGMVNAAAATQQMLDMFDITGIVHFGISGNLNNNLSIADVVIPKQVANTGLWNWMNPNGTVDPNDVAHLEFADYNVPGGDGVNLLGKIGYGKEEIYSVSGEPNTPSSVFWVEVSKHWLQLATSLEGMELERCVNSSFCLPKNPKLVVGLRGSTSNIFMDNGAYRNFLSETFEVSSADMESSAVAMTGFSNGFPVLVIRGMSDLAGGQSGENAIDKFGSLAALNAAKAVLKFISKLPVEV